MRGSKDRQRPYKLYYDPEFVFDRPNVMYKPRSGEPDREARVRRRVDSIKLSLPKDGMRNPVVIYMKPDGRFKLHPGKCRITAAKELGWKTVPALIIDKYEQYKENGKPITPEEGELLFTDDQYVKYNKGVYVPTLKKHKFKGELAYPGEVVKYGDPLP